VSVTISHPSDVDGFAILEHRYADGGNEFEYVDPYGFGVHGFPTLDGALAAARVAREELDAEDDQYRRWIAAREVADEVRSRSEVEPCPPEFDVESWLERRSAS
jgi:hypothetical protein